MMTMNRTSVLLLEPMSTPVRYSITCTMGGRVVEVERGWLIQSCFQLLLKMIRNNTRLEEQTRVAEQERCRVEAERVEMMRKLDDAREAIERAAHEERVLAARLQQLEQHVVELQSKALLDESIRRSLHNQVQELRGNVRVYARVRPALPGAQQLAVPFPEADDGQSISVFGSDQTGFKGNALGKKKWEFKLDRVFWADTCQSKLFDDVSQLVQSALDGFVVSILAFGQTGSGKTVRVDIGWVL